MSNSFRSVGDASFNVKKLWQIEARCTEMLELHETPLLEAYRKDKKQIQRLEKELLNCSEQIDYLQDQLDERNMEVDYLQELVYSLKLKLEDMEDLRVEAFRLREELQRSNYEQFYLLQELMTKETELEKSTLSIEKLEESISSMALESECEVESMKLDMMALEQSFFEAKKIQEETVEKTSIMSALIDELQLSFQEAQKIIVSLSEKNRELKDKLDTVNMSTRTFSQKVEEWLESTNRSDLSYQSSLSEHNSHSNILKDMSASGEVLGPLLGRLAKALHTDEDIKEEMKSMSCQMLEYDILVQKLKEELKEEKLKAKEDAEELAQEMAELRYQITGLLEEECKRRARIEQASLQRITELEAQLQREKRKPLFAVTHLPEM